MGSIFRLEAAWGRWQAVLGQTPPFNHPSEATQPPPPLHNHHVIPVQWIHPHLDCKSANIIYKLQITLSSYICINPPVLFTRSNHTVIHCTVRLVNPPVTRTIYTVQCTPRLLNPPVLFTRTIYTVLFTYTVL